MDNVSLKTIKEILSKIEEYQKIIILRHTLPDGDAYGSQLGLKHIIQDNFTNKKVLAGGLEQPEMLSYFEKIDLITESDYQNALVIVTDCSNIARIDDQRFKLGKEIIKIDHHPNVEPFGNINWVLSEWVSASEMITYFAKTLNLKISALAARALFAGIITDSGRFLIKGISSLTFSLAAFLLETGFNLLELYHAIYERNFNSLKVDSWILKNIQKKENVLYLIIKEKNIRKLNTSADRIANKIDLMRNITNYPIWISFVQYHNFIRVEFRSNQFKINQVAATWGGGGHDFIAGAKIQDWNNVEKIINDCIKLMKT